MPDDAILVGDVVTMDGSRPSAEAVSVDNGRIAAVGAVDEVMARRGAGTEVVDLGEATLLPGLVEPHTHPDLCAHDRACGVEWARDAGAERVVVMGHSFGGAVAIRAAVVMTASVAGVVTFATQAAGCEAATALGGRPLLLFHGDRDEILPAEASLMVQAIAGYGDIEMLPGDGNLLAKSHDIIAERLNAWLHEVLGL